MLVFLFYLVCCLLPVVLLFPKFTLHNSALYIIQLTFYITFPLTLPPRGKQLAMSIRSIVKKRSRQNQSQKARKKRKNAENMIFYGFECPHCPQDEEGDSEVW